MGTLLILINFLLFLFWIRLWADPQREFYFNPFLSGPIRMVDTVVGALGLPPKLTCLFILTFGLTFRAALAFRFSHNWQISLGSVFFFQPVARQFPHLLLFSVLDFMFFIVRLWSAYVVIRLITPPSRRDRATEAFHFAVRPFSRLLPLPRLAVLALAHLLLVLELTQNAKQIPHPGAAALGGNLPSIPHAAIPDALAKLLSHGWMAAASFADGLNAMRAALVAVVIGGFLAAILQNQVLRQICFEAMNVILGRFARAPFAAGMIDFTPLIFFFALQILYSAFSSLLWALTTMIA